MTRTINVKTESQFGLLRHVRSTSAHHWGREIGKLGHDVRLIAPQYVKPYVKRQKNDAVDAEAIAEAASRPSMRFVAVKSAEQQGQAMVLKTRDLLTGQRTQTINALRGHSRSNPVSASPVASGANCPLHHR